MAEHSMTAAQRVYPFLYVEDVKAYLAYLQRAFGFATRVHHVDPDDEAHQHAEVILDGAVVMIGRAATKWGTIAAKKAAGLTAGVYFCVDDIDAHFRRARAAGALIESELEEKPWGARMYTARDPEGHQWYFSSPLRE